LNKGYKASIIEDIINAYIRYKVSLRRQGRKEILRVGGTKAQSIFQFFTRKRTSIDFGYQDEGVGEQD
ncbi:MAG: hypothetical protein QN229_07295, partial [Desulfurococcaceae archaeon TW002]